jgi:hypothetical protein
MLSSSSSKWHYILTNQQTNQLTPWNSVLLKKLTVSQLVNIPRLSRNLKRVQKTPTPFPILRQIKPVHVLPNDLFKIPKLMPIFRCSPRSERSDQVRVISISFVTCQDFTVSSSEHFAQTPKLVNHRLSVAGDSLFNTFAATLRIWRPSPLPTTWRRTISWWQEYIYHGTRYPSEWHCILTAQKRAWIRSNNLTLQLLRVEST